MVSETLDELEYVTELLAPSGNETEQIYYSVGVMAYNEEANIKRTLHAILEQSSVKARVAEIIVVASGCTDNTVALVQEMMQADPCIQLLVQERREGKASAINLFLQHARSSILVLVGADIIPEKNALEKLCVHFAEPGVGMVGARPVPVNDQDTFVGHAVHLLWRLHDRMARRNPKLGEVVAFRNIVHRIPDDTAVDEISIQSIIAKRRLRLVYEPAAVVYNKGPMTIRDFLKQRRRIYAGHLQVRTQERYEASTMNTGAIVRELVACAPYTVSSPRQTLWTFGAIAMEGLARMQGQYDAMRKHSHHVWQAVPSTKALEDEQRKLRRICNTQSVIVFQIRRGGADESDFQREYEQRLTMHMMRKLIPLLRKHVRKDDLLSINGSDTLVAVLNAERCAAEFIAMRLKQVMEDQQVRLGKRMAVRPQVSYHAVSFAQY